MSDDSISKILRNRVKERAKYCCEYCLYPNSLSFSPHEIDYVIAKKHGGSSNFANLALSCWRCNRQQGSDFVSFDTQTGEFNFLYNPRIQKWMEHFQKTKTLKLSVCLRKVTPPYNYFNSIPSNVS
ncbi:HNH endonuclease [Baaleninema simplex]|uniref:HNH endonuclease n=1 Tax=Baaleninema simplex TaxID=2862350 RepID=UPI001FE0EF01|nr:HNH endonuclease signature motif containing protein [Baaleninema simplex]